MKNKIIIGLFVSIIFVFVLNTIDVSAETVNELINSCNTVIKIISTDSGGNNYISYYTSEGNNYMTYNSSLNRFSRGTGWYHTNNGYTDDETRPVTLYNDDYFGAYAPPNEGFTSYLPITSYTFIILKGAIPEGFNSHPNNFDSIEDYEQSIAPSWWDNVAQIFTEFATSPAMGAVLSGDWLGYINEVLFGELWSVQVGEGEDELAQFYTVSATPSPSPTPIPTQIPVQVNIDPTTGNVIYHYTIDVSGTPVPTSSPFNPNPPAGSGGGGSELTEPFGVTDYYEPDDSLSIPNLRIFQFQLDLPGSNTDIGVDSLDNNVEVMNGYLEDNADAITTVSSFFQVIPSDWFLLLGAIACFPIIAAMIKSLLGG